MTTQLAPTPVFKAFDNNGNPLANGQLFSYVTGTSTPQATWVDFTQTTQNTNPVILNARGECNLWLDPTLTYKLVLKDPLGNQIWSVDNISGALNPNSSIIPAVDNTYTLGNAQFSWANLYLGPGNATAFDPNTGNIGYYAQTAAEISAAVTPVNFSYPPMMVDRYATNSTPGTTDMTAAWQAAIAVASVAGGVVTCLQAVYLITQTLSITGPASIDGGNSFVNYAASGVPGGAILSAPSLNAAILSYGIGSRFVRLDNINLAGNFANPAANPGQDGIIIGTSTPDTSHGIRIRNVSITDAGRFGINVVNSVAGTYDSITILSHAGVPNTGIFINCSGSGNAVTANLWRNVNISGCPTGIDVGTNGGGTDFWYNVTCENGTNGIAFESGITGQRFYAVHTEGNGPSPTGHPVLFKAGSNFNVVEFESVGSSVEGLPLNQGGAQNFWLGNPFIQGTGYLKPVIARCIQRVSTSATAKVNGTSLSAVPSGTVPTNGQGVQILSQTITPQNTGTKLVVRAYGFVSAHTAGAVVVTLFGPGSNSAVAAQYITQDVADNIYPFNIEFETTAGTQNTPMTFTVNAGSTTTSDSVTFGGANNVLFGGGVQVGGISIEEYLPSSG